MKSKIPLFLMIIFAALFSAQFTPVLKIGDFQSNGSGNWTSSGSWQVYNGTGWVAATSYPGQGTTSVSQGNYNVYIQPGNIISVATNSTYYFGNLYILGSPLLNAPPPFPTVLGELQLIGNMTRLNLLGSKQNVFVYGGRLTFTANNEVLGLLLGNSIITAYPDNADCNKVSNLIQPTGNANSVGGNCTGNKQIYFVNSNGVDQHFAVCNGNNSPYNFSALNCAGGSISPTPTVTPNPICAGASVTFGGGYTGFISPTDQGLPKYFVWSLVSAPPGYTFPTTAANVNANFSATFAMPGTYVFNLEVYYNSTDLNFTISGNQTVTLVVNPASSALCACYKSVSTLSTPISSNFGITSLDRAGGDNVDNWPMVREGAYVVLESKTKGFVINRLTTVQLNTIASSGNGIDGMIAYDTTVNAIKIYVQDTTTPANTGWHIFDTPACPDN